MLIAVWWVSTIGIEWAETAVAYCRALGVGLGFGLQEIFANFISGLIILFEKPIRIGDTVTIRDLTGSVAAHQYPRHHHQRLGP